VQVQDELLQGGGVHGGGGRARVLGGVCGWWEKDTAAQDKGMEGGGGRDGG
jgi:hypothetical protein